LRIVDVNQLMANSFRCEAFVSRLAKKAMDFYRPRQERCDEADTGEYSTSAIYHTPHGSGRWVSEHAGQESPESVRSGIADGSLLQEGDWVRVYSTSGESIYLQFERVRNGQIIGHQHAKLESDTTDDTSTYWTEVTVPLSEIERVERGEFSAGKTAAAVGVSALWILILFAIAFASLMSGG
jgi:hypothetical protein